MAHHATAGRVAARLVVLLALAGLAQLGLAGEIRVQQWKNVEGFQITDTLAEGELTRTPDATWTSRAFEAASNIPDALRLSALVVAPADGEYRFLIAGDDTAILLVSDSEKSDGLKQVAMVPAAGSRCEWRRYAAQRSAGIRLQAHHKYLVQAISKNGNGPGHVEVGWVLPNGQTEGPIPASRVETIRGEIDLPRQESVKATVTLKPQPAAATAPGQHLFPSNASVEVAGKHLDMSYLMYLPTDYAATTDKRPLFIFLHGNDHQGMDLNGILNEGPAQYLNQLPELQQWFPMIMLCPQLPPDWRWDSPGAASITVGLIEQICQRYPRIDRDRIYLSGLSMGGKGTWLVALQSPSTFAAIAPISAVAVHPKLASQRLAGLNGVWIICGENDGMFTAGSKQMNQVLSPTLGGRVKLTVVPGADHGCWGLYYPDRMFYEELLKYRRSGK